MKSFLIIAMLIAGFFGWSFLQAKESIDVIKKEFEKKNQMELSYFYELDHIAIAQSSKFGGTL